MPEMTLSTHTFEFVGNDISLDFVNTLSDRPSSAPRESLTDYRELLSWSMQANILTQEEVLELLEEAQQRPDAAAVVLQRAIELREAIYRTFEAIAEDALPADSDLAILNAFLAEAMCHACIVHQGDHFVWDWSGKEGALERVLWPIVRAAADLLTSGKLQSIKVCADNTCRWLFLDTSKNQSRRWCDMKDCGNRSKVRKHLERKKST